MPADRPRPYIPLRVRVAVAMRQCKRIGSPTAGARAVAATMDSWEMQLRVLLPALGFEKPQLDHDPALILRPFNKKTGKYTPPANDPDYLVYREKAEHQQKTTGRKPGALRTVTTKGSDIGLKSKFARLEGRTKKRPKQKIPQRKNPWPTGRKIGA